MNGRMLSMIAMYKKELRSYFTSMTGYVFIAFFLVIIGIYYVVYNMISQYANFEYVLSSVSFVFVILIPILTMRLMAEEKKQKTDQLLFTSPISEAKIIAGKYFAVITVFLIVIAVISLYPLILSQFGTVPLESAYCGILGFGLLGCAYIAIGLFVSTLTESQVVAAVLSFVIILITTLMDGIVGMLPTDNKTAWIILSVLVVLIAMILYVMMHNLTVAVSFGIVGELIAGIIYFVNPSMYDGIIVRICNWFSVIARFDNFTLGILDLSAVVYYISIVVLFLFLTVQAIKKRRWN